MSRHVRVFVIESPSALDLLEGHSETKALTALCELLDHPIAGITVRSQQEFAATLKHITSINPDLMEDATREWPLCIHIAAHGDKDGLAFGADDVSWEDLARYLSLFIRRLGNYPGRVLVVISACGAGEQEITRHLETLAKREDFEPPAYLFVTVGDKQGLVDWGDAVVAWSIFYRQIGGAELNNREDIKSIIDKIKLAGAETLKYFRWDASNTAYKPYRSKLRVLRPR